MTVPGPARARSVPAGHARLLASSSRPCAMGDAYIFSLQPTFTQGLILGQCSILFLLVIVLKYLFFDTDAENPYKISSYQPRAASDNEQETDRVLLQRSGTQTGEEAQHDSAGAESADWLNVVLHQVRQSSPIFSTCIQSDCVT